MRAQLVPLDGGSAIEIVKDLTVVGRREECDLRLEHKSVSKMHCVLVKTDGLLLLRDLGSTNGTRVNGRRVRRAALLPDDQLGIANFRFRVYLGPDLPPPAADLAREHTLRLEASEVAGMVEKLRGRHADRDSAELPVPKPLQRNQLPDVYPDDEKK